jgi:hypothetical protein
VVASYLLPSTSDLLQLSCVLTPQGRKQARLQLIKEIRHFEASGSPSDENNVWSSVELQSDVLELFDFESDLTARDDEEDDLD